VDTLHSGISSKAPLTFSRPLSELYQVSCHLLKDVKRFAGIVIIAVKKIEMTIRLGFFAASTQGKHGSTRLKHFTAQLLRLRLRLPGLQVIPIPTRSRRVYPQPH